MNLLKLFIEKGADIHILDYLEDTPVLCAVNEGQIEAVQYLLGVGSRLDTDRPNKNPLFTAIYKGDARMARYLIADAAIDPHVIYRGISGKLKNALSFAQERNQQEIIALLTSAGCRLPVEGTDQPCFDASAVQASDEDDSDQSEEIKERLSLAYGHVETLVLQELAPVDARLNITINLIRPTEENPFVTLFTVGMSDLPMNAPAEGVGDEYQYAELIMHLPPHWEISTPNAQVEEWFWPFEWLRKLAYYPHLNNSWLGGATAVVSPAEEPPPLASNTKLSCFLLLSDFENCSPIILNNGKTIRLYTVIPIHTSERDLEKTHGISELVKRFHDAGFTAVLDIDRPSVGNG